MSKKVLIAAGGSGGHIFPAMALAQRLRQVEPSVEILFAGGGLSRNPYFERGSFPYRDVACGTFASKSWWQKFKALIDTCKGVSQGRRLLRRFRPDVVVGFGSFHSFPLLMAARSCHFPLVLHEANAVPGKVNRRFAPYARVTGVHFPCAQPYLQGRSVEVDLPLREGYTLTYGSKAEARKRFLLHPQKFTFLVFGGSQGAAALNTVVSRALLGHLAERTKQFQLIHITGDESAVLSLRAQYEKAEIRAYVTDFVGDMDQAWMAADLLIGRAGGATLAEMTEFEVPALLIPYPYATDHHQEHNADFMAKTVKGAVKLLQGGLTPESLARQLSDLVANDRETLERMREALGHYRRTRQRRDLCSLVCEVGGLKVR